MRREPLAGAGGLLLLAGSVAGLLVPRNAYHWSPSVVLLLGGLAALVAVLSASVAYAGSTWPVLPFALVPYLGSGLSYSMRYGGLERVGSLDPLAGVVLASLVVGASWGLAGGVVGFLVGTTLRAVRLEDHLSTAELARRLAFVCLATGVATALLAWSWVYRGLGDAV